MIKVVFLALYFYLRLFDVIFASDRIVSLAPNVTEVLFSLKKENQIVGNTLQCDYPKQSQNLQKVGDFLNPSREKILSLKPTFIIVTDTHPKSILAFLDKHHLDYFVLRTKSIRLFLNDIQFLGQRLNASSHALILTQKLSNMFSLTSARKPKIEAFFALQWTPLYSINGSHFISEIMDLAGFKLITRDFVPSFPIVNKEFVFIRHPEVVFFPRDIEHVPLHLKNSTSLKDTQWISLESDLILRLGPRILESFQRLQTMYETVLKKKMSQAYEKL